MTIDVGFIGLGKLGLPIAEVMATHYKVTGYDISPRVSESVHISHKIEDAVIGKKFIFIAVQTPHDPKYDGTTPSSNLPVKDFNYSYVKTVLNNIRDHLQENQTLILISTVLPGTTREQFIPLLPEGKNIQFIYNPYLIAMGTEKFDFINPEMVIIGHENASSQYGEELIDFYKPLLNPKSRYVLGTWEEAEAIKIFYNTFISAKLSLVNMILDVSEKLGNMNVDTVTQALAQSDQRIISKAYMVAGLGDGGPCHPRDNIALRNLATKLELGYDLFQSISHSREMQAKNLAIFLSNISKNIVFLGKAYKPNVDLTDGSYSLLVSYYLKELQCNVHFYDPQTGDTEKHPFTNDFCYLVSFWTDWVDHYQFEKNVLVVDPWRKKERPSGPHYINYGHRQ